MRRCVLVWVGGRQSENAAVGTRTLFDEWGVCAQPISLVAKTRFRVFKPEVELASCSTCRILALAA